MLFGRPALDDLLRIDDDDNCTMLWVEVSIEEYEL